MIRFCLVKGHLSSCYKIPQLLRCPFTIKILVPIKRSFDFPTIQMVEPDGTANSHPYNITYKLASGILPGFPGQDVFI